MTHGKPLVGTSGRCALDFTSKPPCKITQRIHPTLLLRCWFVPRKHFVYVHCCVSCSASVRHLLSDSLRQLFWHVAPRVEHPQIGVLCNVALTNQFIG